MSSFVFNQADRQSGNKAPGWRIDYGHDKLLQLSHACQPAHHDAGAVGCITFGKKKKQPKSQPVYKSESGVPFNETNLDSARGGPQEGGTPKHIAIPMPEEEPDHAPPGKLKSCNACLTSPTCDAYTTQLAPVRCHKHYFSTQQCHSTCPGFQFEAKHRSHPTCMSRSILTKERQCTGG